MIWQTDHYFSNTLSHILIALLGYSLLRLVPQFSVVVFASGCFFLFSFFWRVSLWPLRILLTSYQLGSWQKHCHNLCIHFFADISPSLPSSLSFIFDYDFLLCCGLHFRNFSSSFAPTPTATPTPTSKATPMPTPNVLRPSQL